MLKKNTKNISKKVTTSPKATPPKTQETHQIWYSLSSKEPSWTYCWWKKSQTTTWYVKNPANNWISYRSLNWFSHQKILVAISPSPPIAEPATSRWVALRGSGDCGSLGTFSWCAWRTLAWTPSRTGAGGKFRWMDLDGMDFQDIQS